MSEIFKEGQQAYLDNISSTDNPYAGNTDEHDEWHEGWVDKFSQVAAESWYEYLANCEHKED